MRRICPRCGYSNDKNVNFCKLCGILIISKRATNSSNTSIDDTSPTELKVEDYSLSMDLNACKAVKNIPLISKASELLISLWQEPLQKVNLLGDSVRISREQIPSIYRIAEEAASILDVKLPEIFIKYDPTYNAYTFGTNDKHVIVLHSSLVNDFTENELRYIIGHELGHIKSNHVTYSTIYYLIINGIGMFFQPVFAPLKLSLQIWQREAEKTADRAGYLATLNPVVAVQSLLMLSLGSRKLLEQINLDEYLRQEDELSDFYVNCSRIFGMNGTHPFLVSRIRHIIEFVNSDIGRVLYERLINKKSYFTLHNVTNDNNKKQFSLIKSTNKRFCNTCGFEIENISNKYCDFCGSKIKE